MGTASILNALENVAQFRLLVFAEPGGSGIRRAAIAPKQPVSEENSACQQQQGRDPKDIGLGRKPGPQQDEFAISGDDKVDDILMAVTGLQSLANDQAKVASQWRIGIIDGLVLANETPQLG